ncbi:MAG TPA: pitrilysin family protein [Clostridiaceae bacterium]
MEKTRFNAFETVLGNGIQICTIKRNTNVTAIHIGVKIGSLYEADENKGISHFIEHMLFKGTLHRDNKTLNDELEDRAGEYNAYTDHNSTVYSITALAEETEKSLELLSDMLINSNFPSDEIEKERGVILAEIRSTKDDIEDLSFKKSKEAAFIKGPLRFDTIGDEKTVNSFNQARLIEYYKMFYVPNNCYISIVSPFEHKDIIKIINKYFLSWEKKDFRRNDIIVEENYPCKKITYKKDIEQSTIIYIYTFHNLDRKQELALKILNHRLGESANSILFRSLREEKGLAYDVFSQMDITNKVKTLYIYTSVSENHIEEALASIDEAIVAIVNREIIFDAKVIDLMKKVLKTAVYFTIEDATDLSNYVLHQKIDEESIYEFIEDMTNLDDIEAEDIYKVSEIVLREPTIHILRPN